MKPGFASIYRYSIPFVRPVPVRGSSLDTRDGLVIGVQTPDSLYAGYGEIAPLQGLHEETLNEALEMCTSLLPTLDLSIGDLSFSDAGRNLPSGLFPSVQAGIEMSLLNLQSAVTASLPSFPGAPPEAAKTLPLNALLFGSAKSVLSMAEEYFHKGYRTFKLKVHAAEPELAVEQVRSLRNAFGDEISLRLDSNRSFELEDACSLFSRIPRGTIEYIEEPLADPYGIPEFFSRTGLRAALDESLWINPCIWNELPHECLGGVVLKPSRLGSFSRTLHFALKAEEKGIPAVISAAYETGISLGFYARLASVISVKPAPCGLDTFRQLSRDIVPDAFSIKEGCLLPEKAYRNTLKPDLSTLELVETWIL